MTNHNEAQNVPTPPPLANTPDDDKSHPRFIAGYEAGLKDGKLDRPLIDWPAVTNAIQGFVDGYEMFGEDDAGREGTYTPTATDRALLIDAIHGLLGDDDFLAAFRYKIAPGDLTLTASPDPRGLHVAAHLGSECVHSETLAPPATLALPLLNDDLVEILGRPNFHCAPLAEAMRLGGHDIKQRSENEQATVLHMMLGHYLADPENWRENVGKAMQGWLDSAKQPTAGDAA